jgi:hypothetical protein
LCGGVWGLEPRLVALLWLVKLRLTCSLVVTLDLTVTIGTGELEPLFSSALPRLQDEPAGLEPGVASTAGGCCCTRERR